ncbi:MAG: M28 family peptidase, partial [Spirochaetales bacterium]|nr:M28 family peptidase [Spirochaetales bacterium]
SAGHRPPPELTARVGDEFLALLSSSALLGGAATQWDLPAGDIVGRMNDGIAPGTLRLDPLHARLGVDQFDPVSGIPARNVAGVLPGGDPNRFIIVGAHHDHLGTIVGEGAVAEDDRIFNGADDNASGVAVVLELARRLAEAELEKSVVFVTFSGEEQGLLGSGAFASSRIVDLSAVDLMINVDMAARNAPDPVLVYQGGDLPIRRSRLQSIADSASLPVTLVTDGVGGSDYIPFEQSGVPVIFSFSGFHDDYHGVDDEADRLDYDRLASVTEFVLGIVLSTAVSRNID